PRNTPRFRSGRRWTWYASGITSRGSRNEASPRRTTGAAERGVPRVARAAVAGRFFATAGFLDAAGRGLAALAAGDGFRAGFAFGLAREIPAALARLTRCAAGFFAVLVFFFVVGTAFFRTPPGADRRPLRAPPVLPARDRCFGPPP